MARPQMGYAPKAGKARKSGPEKMRMSHIRLRKDIKRIEAEQAKAAAAEAAEARRKNDRCLLPRTHSDERP